MPLPTLCTRRCALAARCCWWTAWMRSPRKAHGKLGPASAHLPGHVPAGRPGGYLRRGGLPPGSRRDGQRLCHGASCSLRRGGCHAAVRELACAGGRRQRGSSVATLRSWLVTSGRTRASRALAENPLLLTTLLVVKRWIGELPRGTSPSIQRPSACSSAHGTWRATRRWMKRRPWPNSPMWPTP